MPYPKQLLTEDEELVLDLRPHWLTIAPQSLITSALLVLWIRASVGDGWLWQALGYVAAASVAVSTLWLLAALASWFTTNFAVTSERIVVRTGVFAKSGIEIPLGNINTVVFKQSVFERIVGAGDLVIESASEGGQQHIEDVRNPNNVQQVIYRCKEQLEDRGRTRSARAIANAVGSGQSAVSELATLHRLLQDGAIGREEFDRLKAKLLQ